MEADAIDNCDQAHAERMLKHLREYSHIALKGHFLVEESLGRIIAQHCRASFVLDNLNMTFYTKANLTRALVGDVHGTVLWVLVWKLYLIQVDVAQKVESPRVRRLIKEFVELKSQWADEPLPAAATDSHLASSFADSIQYVLGALATIEMDGRGSR